MNKHIELHASRDDVIRCLLRAAAEPDDFFRSVAAEEGLSVDELHDKIVMLAHRLEDDKTK